MLANVINRKAPKGAQNTTLWEARFNPPYPNNRAWLDASLAREYAFWQLVLNDESLHHLIPGPIPAGANTAAFLSRFRAFIASFRDPQAHTFRTEPFYALTHGKFTANRDPILMKGKKINCIVDWEYSGYFPVSENIKDILQQYRGAGLVDPDIWPEDAEPFSKCHYYGWSWEDCIENMRINRWQLERTWDLEEARRHPNPADQIAFGDRFNWYGRITPNDLRYGDKYADQDIDEDDGDARGTRFRESVRMGHAADVVYTSNAKTAITSDFDPEWWHGPVMHLVDDYVQTHLGFPPEWSWQDPVIEDWAINEIGYGQPFEV